MNLIMVSTTQHHQIVDIGPTTVLPLDHMVHLAPTRWSIAAGVGAAAVAGRDRAPGP
jgi:hypothetical protein